MRRLVARRFQFTKTDNLVAKTGPLLYILAALLSPDTPPLRQK